MNTFLYIFYLIIIIILSAFIIHFQLLIHKRGNKVIKPDCKNNKQKCKKCEKCTPCNHSSNINNVVEKENSYIKQLNKKIRNINSNIL